jgi:hypothetical protein
MYEARWRWLRFFFVAAATAVGGWIALDSPGAPWWQRLAGPVYVGGVAWLVSFRPAREAR